MFWSEKAWRLIWLGPAMFWSEEAWRLIWLAWVFKTFENVSNVCVCRVVWLRGRRPVSENLGRNSPRIIGFSRQIAVGRGGRRLGGRVSLWRAGWTGFLLGFGPDVDGLKTWGPASGYFRCVTWAELSGSIAQGLGLARLGRSCQMRHNVTSGPASEVTNDGDLDFNYILIKSDIFQVKHNRTQRALITD